MWSYVSSIRQMLYRLSYINRTGVQIVGQVVYKSVYSVSDFASRNKKTEAKLRHESYNGAGDGNRTRVMSLEGSGSTIEPHPQ